MRNLILVLLVIGALSILAACGGSDDVGGDKSAAQTDSAQADSGQTDAGQAAQPAGDAPAVAAAISTSCAKCHGLGRVCAKIGELDKAGWAVVIARMITNGSDINRQTALGAAEFMGQQPAAAKAALCD